MSQLIGLNDRSRYVAIRWNICYMTILADIALRLETLIEPWRKRFLDIDSAEAHTKSSPDRWSISEVVGHLVDSACNNHQRFVRAQNCSDFTFPKYDQNDWVSAANYRESTWESLVELWYHYNRQIAVLIRNIDTASLATPCTITPYETCTLGFLVKDYVDHMEHHLKILEIRITE